MNLCFQITVAHNRFYTDYNHYKAMIMSPFLMIGQKIDILGM